MSHCVRFGIVGCGNIARKFIEASRAVPSAVITGLASRTYEHALAMANNYGIHTVFSSYDEMLSSDKIDAVYISSLNSTHFELANKAIDAGKSVICEKPFMLSVNEAKAVFDKAKQKNVFVMEAMWTRFLPVYQKLLNIVDSGAIGDVKCVTGEYFYKMPKGFEERLLTKQAGGGAIFDIGTYCLNFAEMFIKSQVVKVDVVSRFAPSGVDLESSFMLHFNNEKAATFHLGVDMPAPLKAEVFGNLGRIIVPEFNRATEAEVYIYGNDFDSIRKNGTVISNVPAGGRVIKINEPFKANGFEYEISAACNAILNGQIQCKESSWDNSIRTITTINEMVDRKINC